MIYNPYYFLLPYFPPDIEKPPTLYAILNSIVNGDKNYDDYSKIPDLAKEAHETIFNFEYPLSKYIDKDLFEIQILNHFIMRRIGFETVTAFQIQLNSKLNEIMPLYNKMFDALENWSIFDDGETTIREGFENKTNESNNTSNNTLKNETDTENVDIQDRRFSDTPQNKLQNIRDGRYVTNYNYDTINNNSHDTSTSNGTSNSNNKGKDDNVYQETIKRSPSDKIYILKEMQENIKSIYTLIYEELEILFYGLV